MPETTADRLRRHPFVVAGVVALVVAVWVQWRVLGHLGTRVLSDPDMSLFVWSMGHAPRQVGHFRNPFLTDAIFATTGGANLAYNATAPGLALLMTPVTLLAGPIAAVNVLAVLTPVLNTLAARRLLAVTTRATGIAPLIGALLVGFSPLVLMHLRGRFQLAFQAVALLLLAELWVIGREWSAGRGVPLRRALVLGGLAGLQLWIGTELLAIAAIVALIALVISIVAARRRWRHPLRRSDLIAGGAAIGVLLVVASPFLFAFVGGREPYQDSYHVAARPLFGLRLANATTPTEVELLDSMPLKVDRGELGTFPDEDTGYLSVAGLVVVVVVASGWRRLDALRRGALVTLAVCWLLALGPSMRWSGAGSGGVPGPWRLVQALPFVQEIVANRMTFGVFLALGVLVATSSSKIAATAGRREGVLRAAALVCLPVLMVPAPNDHVHAASGAADDALRRECGGELVMTAPQGREQDGMAWQSRAAFDFDLVRGFAFRESSEPKGPLTLLDTAAAGGVVDVTAATAELNGLGVGCVLAAADSPVVVQGITTVLGPPNIVGDVAIGNFVVTEARGWFADLTPLNDAREAANERLFRRLLLAVVSAGAALRIVVLVSKWNRGLLLNDSLWYSGQAQGLADGHFFQEFFLVSGAEHAPLTSIALAPASFLPRPEFWQRATMTAIGICGIVLIALVARRVGGRRVAIVAVAIAAFYPNIWMGDALIMSETLSIALICIALLAALRYRERMDVRSAVLVGLAVGVAAHARSEVLVYTPLFALIGIRALPWRTWARTAAPLVAATLVVLIPWTAFNLSRYERPVLMSTNDGTTLLGANCPATYSGPAMGGWILTCLDDDLGKTDEDASERSARQRRQAMAYANQHKTRLPLVAIARVARAVDLYGLEDLIRGDVGEERARWSIWTGIVCWWMLAPLAAVGLWRNRRRFGITLFAPPIGVAITTIVFYGSHRLRAPVEPVVVVGAALFLANVSRIRDAITARLAWPQRGAGRERGRVSRAGTSLPS